MKALRFVLVLAILAGIAPGVYGEESSTCSWLRPLPNTKASPYGAVGYIGNGCTATLIHPRHILTAAQCLVNEDNSSEYWSDIYFYPNYNGGTGRKRIRIERAVVGAHGNLGLQYFTSDWAIARLAAPATGFPVLAINPGNNTEEQPVRVGHYSRDPLYFDPQCANPPYATERGCTPGWTPYDANVWWQNGFVSQGKITVNTDLSYNTLTAPGLNGSEGAPHLVKDTDGEWKINGITHALVSGEDCAGQEGPWAGRFFRAPWFAANVAVSSAPSAADRTGVFVIDSDRNWLVYRERTTSGSTDPFSFYELAKSMEGGAFAKIAAFKLGGTGLPGVVVLNKSGELWEVDRGSDNWTDWRSVSTPAGDVLTDIDTATTIDGAAVLYAVNSRSSGGSLYRRARTSAEADADWQPSWSKIVKSDSFVYKRVTAVRHEGDRRNQVWMLTTTDSIRTVKTTGEGWTEVTTFEGPPLPSGQLIADVDAGWNSKKRALLVALSSTGVAWYREADSKLSTASWSSWQQLPTLIDPGVPINRGNVELVSVSASRWEETDGDVVVPVVFATDNWGNVYQTTYTEATSTWSYWMPFYGKRINSSQSAEVID